VVDKEWVLLKVDGKKIGEQDDNVEAFVMLIMFFDFPRRCIMPLIQLVRVCVNAFQKVNAISSSMNLISRVQQRCIRMSDRTRRSSHLPSVGAIFCQRMLKRSIWICEVLTTWSCRGSCSTTRVVSADCISWSPSLRASSIGPLPPLWPDESLSQASRY
jgi:hypothetical protein